jgi:hypothetical protein
MELTIEQREEVLNVAQEAFFAAMLDGYCGERKFSTKVVDDDGTVTITFVSGNYKVVDRYHKNQLGDYSSGTTTIFNRLSEIYKWVPVWWMSYGGQYSEKAIPFLKKALRATYEKRKFCAGRGEPFQEVLFFYTNSGYTFRFFNQYFEGEEKVYYGSDLIGHHIFFGMPLI